MDETVTGYLAPSFRFGSDSVLKATRNGVQQPVTVSSGSGATWYRHYLAATGGSGSASTSPKEFGAYLEALLNAAHGVSDWNVRMSASGRWEITNTAQTWSILWDATAGTDKVARDCLGWTGNIGSTGANTYSTAQRLPQFAIAMIGRDNDTYWRPVQERAGGVMPNGTTYGWRAGNGAISWERSFDVVQSPAVYHTILDKSSAASAAFVFSTMTSPMTAPAASEVVYTWSDFVLGYNHEEIGAAIGSAPGDTSSNILTTFDKVVAGSTTSFDKVYLHPDFLKRAAFAPELMVRNWWGYVRVPGVKLTLTGTGTIA